MRQSLWIVLASALLASSCAGDTTTPAPLAPAKVVNVAGNWRGTAVLAGVPNGTGSLNVTVSQTGGTLSGTWSATYDNAAFNDGGLVSGSVNDATASMTLTPSNLQSGCQYSATGALSGTSSMTGTFATFNCYVSLTGQFQLSK